MLDHARREGAGSRFTGSELQAAFASGAYTEEEYLSALAVLRSESDQPSAERVLCCEMLGRARLEPKQRVEVAEALCRLLKRQLRPPHSGRQATLWSTVVLGALLAIVSGFATFCLTDCVLHDCIEDSLLMGCIYFVPMTLFLWAALNFEATFSDRPLQEIERSIALIALGNLRLPETVPFLARECDSAPFHYSRIAEIALQSALPALTPEHYGCLDRDAVPLLCRLLLDRLPVVEIEGPPIALCSELLTALEKIGDRRAIVAVREIAQKSCSRILADHATRVLPVLAARRLKENESRTLVRGSAAPAIDVSELLRPGGAAQSDSDMLLRPTTRIE